MVVRSDPVEVDYGANEGAWGVYIEDPDGIPMELFQPRVDRRRHRESPPC